MEWMSLVFWSKGGLGSREAIQRRNRQVLLDVSSESVLTIIQCTSRHCIVSHFVNNVPLVSTSMAITSGTIRDMFLYDICMAAFVFQSANLSSFGLQSNLFRLVVGFIVLIPYQVANRHLSNYHTSFLMHVSCHVVQLSIISFNHSTPWRILLAWFWKEGSTAPSIDRGGQLLEVW